MICSLNLVSVCRNILLDVVWTPRHLGLLLLLVFFSSCFSLPVTSRPRRGEIQFFLLKRGFCCWASVESCLKTCSLKVDTLICVGSFSIPQLPTRGPALKAEPFDCAHVFMTTQEANMKPQLIHVNLASQTSRVSDSLRLALFQGRDPNSKGISTALNCD